MTKTSTYPLRLPVSLKRAVEEFFEQRRAQADSRRFRRILKRKGGEPPRPDDVIR